MSAAGTGAGEFMWTASRRSCASHNTAAAAARSISNGLVVITWRPAARIRAINFRAPNGRGE